MYIYGNTYNVVYRNRNIYMYRNRNIYMYIHNFKREYVSECLFECTRQQRSITQTLIIFFDWFVRDQKINLFVHGKESQANITEITLKSRKNNNTCMYTHVYTHVYIYTKTSNLRVHTRYDSSASGGNNSRSLSFRITEQ